MFQGSGLHLVGVTVRVASPSAPCAVVKAGAAVGRTSLSSETNQTDKSFQSQEYEITDKMKPSTIVINLLLGRVGKRI